MKLKTSELEGAALDWAVAEATGEDVKIQDPKCCKPWIGVSEDKDMVEFSPSTDWAQGGPLIERMAINVVNGSSDYTEFYGKWGASADSPVMLVEAFDEQRYDHHIGDAPLEAACRAIVGEILGDEVDVPEDLV